MQDDLPVEVLTELGRVTWAAIKLEDYTEGMCSLINPTDPRIDKRPVSQKIKEAREVLTNWPISEVRSEAIAWLERASQVIEQRNGVLHATPLVWLERSPCNERKLLLGVMPRANRA